MPKHAKRSTLGRTLIKDKFSQNRRHARGESMLHAAEIHDGADWNRINLRSVTESSNLEDFLATAELAGTEFRAERLNVTFVPPSSRIGTLSSSEREELAQKHDKLKSFLRIPRRPAWDETTSAEELDLLERESFLEWRRRLADLETSEGIILTPFEKNLEFWRQLWRVVERSDVVVQIVDARNPLLFRCEDLEMYVSEVSKEKVNVVLVNKADFLTRKQRDAWAKYFSDQGVRAIFFSATNDEEEPSAEDDEKAVPEPGSLGLDAYYEDLDSAGGSKTEGTETKDDAKMSSSDDEAVPYLVEAPETTQEVKSSGFPEIDAMRIHGDPTLISKTMMDRAKEVREKTGMSTKDLPIPAPDSELPVAISELNKGEEEAAGDGDDEWEDMESDSEDSVVDECVDSEGDVVLREEDILEVISLSDGDEPPPSSEDENEDELVGPDGVVAMNEEDIDEIISLGSGGEEPPSSSSASVCGSDDDGEGMEEVDEEEWRRRMKEERKTEAKKQVKFMYEQREKRAEEAAEKNKLKSVKNSGKCLNREELIKFFESFIPVMRKHRKIEEREAKRPAVTIGLVGYPNVGKSSTINSLLMSKKVSVSTTPGKTKHFQTIFLNKDICLCDCPGLVMPSFLSTKAEMVVSGILPIDQLRDHVPAVNLVASLVSRHVLERTYGFVLPKPEENEDPNRPPTSEEFLNCYGFLRGYMTQRGLPDNPRGARYVLKDFVCGKLLYCHPPPGANKAEFEAETKTNFLETKKKHEGDSGAAADMPLNFKRMVKGTQGNPSVREVDEAFFSTIKSGVHRKGATLVKNSMESASSGSMGDSSDGGKPWKKHGNRNKKEKLRRVFNHLDT